MAADDGRTLLLAYVNPLVGRLTRRQMPLGLQLVAAAAQQAGWEVAGRYWGGELTAAAFRDDLKGSRPALVGFYVDLLNVYTVARLLRQSFSEVRPLTILGGPEATFNYRRVLEHCPADLLVRGDGEPVLAQLLQGDLQDPEFLGQIPGLSFRWAGKVHHNPDRAWGSQEDYPFPNRHLLPGWHPTLHLLTARGCPNRCAFCSEARLPYRPRPVAQVKDELAAALEKGQPRWVVIIDDTFTAEPRRAREISRFLQEVYGGPWSCEVTAQEICRHRGLARDLAAAGLTRVQLGLESGHAETLRLYGKKVTRRQLEEAIETLMEAGVKAVYGNFIVGAPNETPEMVRANMEFAQELLRRYPGRLEISASVLTYNPGAPFFEEPEKYGLSFALDTIQGSLDYRSPACATQHLTALEIQQLHDEFWQELAATVEALLKDLTPQEMRDQLFFNDIGFSTPWNKRLLAVPHVAKHYQYVKYEGSHLDLYDIPAGRLADAIPQRTRLEVQLAPDGNVVLAGLSGENKQLNATASFLNEVACGRLTIIEIARLLHDRLPASHRPPFATILNDTVNCYTKLAQEMYIAFVIP